MTHKRFSEVLSTVIELEPESKLQESQRYLVYTKKSKNDNCTVKYEFIVDYGIVVEMKTKERYSYIIQLLSNGKMFYDIYNDNVGGYNNIHSCVCVPTTSEELYFQASTVCDMWYEIEDVVKFEKLLERLKNEYSKLTFKL